MTKDDAPDFAANQKLIVLRALAETPDGRMNETMLSRHLDNFGYSLDRVELRTVLADMEDAGAVVTTIAGGAIMIAEITRRGENHLEHRGSPIQGIDRPSRRA